MPHNLIIFQGSPAPFLKFQMAPRLILLMSSVSKKKEPRYACLSEARGEFRPRQTRQLPSAVDLKGRLLNC